MIFWYWYCTIFDNFITSAMPPKKDSKKDVNHNLDRPLLNLTTQESLNSMWSLSSASQSQVTVLSLLHMHWCFNGSVRFQINFKEINRFLCRLGNAKKVLHFSLRSLYLWKIMWCYSSRWCNFLKTQDFCKNISSKKFCIYFVNT